MLFCFSINLNLKMTYQKIGQSNGQMPKFKSYMSDIMNVTPIMFAKLFASLPNSNFCIITMQQNAQIPFYPKLFESDFSRTAKEV